MRKVIADLSNIVCLASLMLSLAAMIFDVYNKKKQG